MEKFFPAVKKMRIFEGDSIPWSWAKAQDSDATLVLAPPLIPVAVDEEEDGLDEFELAFLDFLEDSPAGLPVEWQRYLASWTDGSFTSCSKGDLLSSTDSRTLVLLDR